jgi:hypothetical protein
MKTKAPQNRCDGSHKQTRRVVKKLLTAVDRTLAAAAEVKKARRELDRLARKKEEPNDQ